MMDTVQLGGVALPGFALGDAAPAKVPFTRGQGFVFGATAAALLGAVAAEFYGEGGAPDTRLYNNLMVIMGGAIGGGIAGALIAPGRSA